MSIVHEDDIQAILPFVQKPSRYIGCELNLAGKDPAGVDLMVALGFPEVYEIGMSHLGIKILYHIINSRADALADRVFTPWVDMELRMRKAGLTLWGLETRTPLNEFDILGISVMHELMYTNILTMLDLGKIPLKSEGRNETHPLVIGGGPCVSNPEPLTPFFDAFVIGEGEVVLSEILDAVRSAKREDLSREAVLESLAEIEGVYIPGFYSPVFSDGGKFAGLEPNRSGIPERIRKRYPAKLSSSFYSESPIVPSARIVQDRLDVELFRGCTRGCRFCHAGFFYRPVRERDAAEVAQHILRGLRQGGWDEFGLLSLSTSDYTAIDPLLGSLKEELIAERVSCSLPSLRADNFSLNLSETMSEIRRTGLTFAPEAGSERLRRVINKPIDHETILDTARAAYEAGWNLIKCYFMIGLPTETDQDIEGIVELSRAIADIARRAGRSNRLNVSVGTFVPKPHTPFQWESFGPANALSMKLGHIRDSLKTGTIRVKWHSVDASRLEAILSRGDRDMARVIERAWCLGSRFDEWTESYSPSIWKEAFERSEVKPDALLSARNVEEVLPWEHIDLHISRKYLLLERERALLARTTEDCRWNRCNGCGIPGAPEDNVLTRPDIRLQKHRIQIGSSTTQSADIEIRLRLIYRKEGMARFLSHLDTIQVFLRALRRLGLPFKYTEGKSPRPKLSSGPPLPTGAIGKEEVLDVWILAEPGEDFVPSIQDALPGGLSVVEAYPVPIRWPAPSAVLTWGDYIVELESLPPGRLEEIRSSVERFLGTTSFPVQLTRKGRAVQVDLTLAVNNPNVRPGNHPPFILSFMSRLLDPTNKRNTASPEVVLEHLFCLDGELLKSAKTTRISLRTDNLRRILRPTPSRASR